MMFWKIEKIVKLINIFKSQQYKGKKKKIGKFYVKEKCMFYVKEVGILLKDVKNFF